MPAPPESVTALLERPVRTAPERAHEVRPCSAGSADLAEHLRWLGA